MKKGSFFQVFSYSYLIIGTILPDNWHNHAHCWLHQIRGVHHPFQSLTLLKSTKEDWTFERISEDLNIGNFASRVIEVIFTFSDISDREGFINHHRYCSTVIGSYATEWVKGMDIY